MFNSHKLLTYFILLKTSFKIIVKLRKRTLKLSVIICLNQISSTVIASKIDVRQAFYRQKEINLYLNGIFYTKTIHAITV